MRRIISMFLVFIFVLYAPSALALSWFDKYSIPKDVDIPSGAYGVWQIPSLDISVPVYKPQSSSQRFVQPIIDAEDSAAYQSYSVGYLISDHAGSNGSWYMNNIEVDAMAFMVTKDADYFYQCYQVCRAQYHSWGYTINGKWVGLSSSRDVACVSCVDSTGSEVYFAIFKLVTTIKH